MTLLTGAYRGRPMVVHAALPDLDAMYFARWLALFKESVEEICPPEAAELFVDRSQRIAESLKLGIVVQRGRGVPVGPAL